MAKPVKSDDIAQVGTVSANGDATIGTIIANAIKHVGKDGVITVEESMTAETTLEVVEGMRFDRGYLSPYFVTDPERRKAFLKDALILTYEQRINSLKELLPVLELVAKKNRSLLIIAEDVEGEALATLVVNKLRGNLEVAAVKAPGFGDRRKVILEDIAILTGARLISAELGIRLENVGLSDLGSAKKVSIDKDNTTIVQGAGKLADIQGRIERLRVQVEDASSEHDRDTLQERLAKLASGVAVIKVGAATETELKEKRARVEDALHATRAAMEEGIVPGGGVALLRAQGSLHDLGVLNDDEVSGVEILGRALEEPLWQIARNAGREGSTVIAKVLENKNHEFGFNAATEKFENLIKAGVVDAAKVTRIALQNAASGAGMMLTTGATVTESRPGASTSLVDEALRRKNLEQRERELPRSHSTFRYSRRPITTPVSGRHAKPAARRNPTIEGRTMNVMHLPLLPAESSLRSALEAMRSHQKSAVVRQAGSKFDLFKAGEIFWGLAHQVASLSGLTSSLPAHNLSPNEIAQWALNISSPPATRRKYENFLDSVGLTYAVIKATQGTAIVVTRHEYNEVGYGGPKDCYCLGPDHHDFPPPTVSPGSTCNQCSFKIHCEYY
jgi:chaperonin GroEL